MRVHNGIYIHSLLRGAVQCGCARLKDYRTYDIEASCDQVRIRYAGLYIAIVDCCKAIGLAIAV